MNAQDSLAWGALLTAQGNGEQLQYDINTDTETAVWSYSLLTGLSIAHTRPGNWRIKPKTRTLTVRTWLTPDGSYFPTLEGGMCAPQCWKLEHTHTFEIES